MFLKLKVFFVLLTSIQLPTAFFVFDSPNVVNYDITSDMVRHLKYNDFKDWSSIDWTAAYFDINQPDLKLVSGDVVSNWNSLTMTYRSDTAGVPKFSKVIGTGVYTLTQQDLNAISDILFNHNYVASNQNNFIDFINTNNIGTGGDFQAQLTFTIDKPLSFYIKSFLFYFDFSNFQNFTGTFSFSFLDYNGDTKYVFTGNIDNTTYQQRLYNLVTMPIQVPNLKELVVNFDTHGQQSSSGYAYVDFGQLNIFSDVAFIPVPPNSPFSPDYEKVPWYDIFGQLRNAFRWCLYGVVGKLLPVDLLQQFCQNLDSLLRHIFNDTLSAFIPDLQSIDLTTDIENIIPVWLFVRVVAMILG